LPAVLGIKVATLDSVMTFQRIAAVMHDHADKLLITGEDRFLGYSLMMGARAALIGMGSALTDAQGRLLMLKKEGLDREFLRLSARLDAFGELTFKDPIEGYIRRMLWALAAEGVIPDEACDDPWGPPLPTADRDAVRRFVRKADP
jgi:4-hydroxy-tetrahydrodipicolinate synthase